jgi:hypothetical protein
MGMAGLSKSRLERMHRVLSGYAERQDLPGLVTLVRHHDDVHVEALGTLAFGDPAPMKVTRRERRCAWGLDRARGRTIPRHVHARAHLRSARHERHRSESGGGGLVSTIDDYFAFSRIMLNRGGHRRQQILSRVAVELMTSDQLTSEQRTGSEVFSVRIPVGV